MEILKTAIAPTLVNGDDGAPNLASLRLLCYRTLRNNNKEIHSNIDAILIVVMCKYSSSHYRIQFDAPK